MTASTETFEADDEAGQDFFAEARARFRSGSWDEDEETQDEADDEAGQDFFADAARRFGH